MKFYTTAAPDSESLQQFDSLEKAVAQATTEVHSGETIRSRGQAKRRYVVCVVAIVEEASMPVKVMYEVDTTKLTVAIQQAIND